MTIAEWEKEGERSAGCWRVRLCRTSKPRVRTLVGATEKLVVLANLTPGNTSSCVIFVNATIGVKPGAFERQNLADLGTFKTSGDQGTRGLGGPRAPEVALISLPARSSRWN